jgi:predicted nucleic acid-binding protein
MKLPVRLVKGSVMTIDVSRFQLNNVADSCAIWNVLSSENLFETARRAACLFCCTDMVRYECLDRIRSRPTLGDAEVARRMRVAIDRGELRVFSLDVEDLQDELAMSNRRRLGRGELSSIVWAAKTRQALLTDDQKARAFGKRVLPANCVQTTPHLLGWLAFTKQVSDRDKDLIIDEHTRLGRPLQRHLEKAYVLAMECLASRSPGPDI